MSQFYIPSSSTTTLSTPAYLDTSDEEDTLPYPTPLPRSDFLAQDFDPAAYLSTLRNRHQTLEDLRGDLRARSQLLSQELLNLVNGNYEEFLSLGGDLKGGDEKVEGVRVGVLGFQREIDGVRKAVQERMAEVRELIESRREVRRDVILGRALLELEEQISELEEDLGVRTEDDDLEEIDDDDDRDFVQASGLTIPVRKLQLHLQRYLLVMQVITRIGSDHPFIVAQRPRLDEVRKTMLLDLATSLRQAKAAKASDALLAVTKMYGDLGAEFESVKILKGG